MKDNLSDAFNSGEPLLAIVGLNNILNKKYVRITQAQIKQALQIEKTIYNECLEFLTEPKFEKIKLNLPEVDLFEIIKQIGELKEIDALTSKILEIDNMELQTDLVFSMSKAISYLQSQAPKLPSSITTRKISPSDFQVSRFNRVYRTIIDPMSILNDMLMGCLSREQVKTMQAVYPNLYEVILTNFNRAGINLTTKDMNFQVPYNKLKMISVLTLSNTTPPDLQTALQSNFSKKEANEDISSSGFSVGSNLEKNSLTKAQKVEFN